MGSMALAQALEELDARVADLRQSTRTKLSALPFPERQGDWDTLVDRHRQAVEVVGWACEELSRIEPPAELTEAWREYAAARNAHLSYERAALVAAVDHDEASYVACMQGVARSARGVEAAAVAVGLSRGHGTSVRPLRVRATPAHLLRSMSHERKELRAGRRWI